MNIEEISLRDTHEVRSYLITHLSRVLLINNSLLGIDWVMDEAPDCYLDICRQLDVKVGSVCVINGLLYTSICIRYVDGLSVFIHRSKGALIDYFMELYKEDNTVLLNRILKHLRAPIVHREETLFTY